MHKSDPQQCILVYLVIVTTVNSHFFQNTLALNERTRCVIHGPLLLQRCPSLFLGTDEEKSISIGHRAGCVHLSKHVPLWAAPSQVAFAAGLLFLDNLCSLRKDRSVYFMECDTSNHSLSYSSLGLSRNSKKGSKAPALFNVHYLVNEQ